MLLQRMVNAEEEKKWTSLNDIKLLFYKVVGNLF